jgi:circadian clock protein KaiC
METYFEEATDIPISTGVQGLDNVLAGGFPFGHLYLIDGDPGTGKTTLGIQFLMEGVRKGEPVLYITLSESEKELRQVARSHRWGLWRTLSRPKSSTRYYTPERLSLLRQ